MTVRHDGLTLDWYGYATLRIEGADATVYTDPGRYGTLEGTWEEQYGGADHPSGEAYDAQDGDLVLVTHDHHYDSDGVRRVASDDATVLVYEAVDAERINDGGRDVEVPEELPYDVQRVAYGDELTVAGVDVEVVAAYNREDGPRADADGNVVHPYEFGCGFVATVDGTPCFWPGDSDAVEEHEGLDVSLFSPSIAQSFTMDRHEAADLAEDLDPDLVLPIHYNTFPDLESDSGAFAADVAKRSVPVVLDES
jgi:L-ascorbate metabolism protein UlaG (beta-lactamase superfamily)